MQSSDSGAVLLRASSQPRVFVAPAKEPPESPRRLSLRPVRRPFASLAASSLLFGRLRAILAFTRLTSGSEGGVPNRTGRWTRLQAITFAKRSIVPIMVPRVGLLPVAQRIALRPIVPILVKE